MSSKRKLQRQKKKQAEKQLKSEVKSKMMSFDRLPDHCVICYDPFDKTNREMVMSWIVVERSKEKRVNLYCPECWENGLAEVKKLVTQTSNAKTEVDRYFDEKKRS